MRRAALAATVALAAIAAGRGAGHEAAAAPRGPDPELPARLGDTGLYAAGRVDAIAANVRPFAPQYPLWTDGAAKRRWMFLPVGQSIDARDDTAWKFPVGTRLWKEFSFGGRKVETRLLWKASEDRWIAASYAWNDEGTGAVLAPADGLAAVADVGPGRSHSIPSRADCAACHGPRLEPLGVQALQLSTDRDPRAIHGEAPQPGMLTLKTLINERLLSAARGDLLDRPPRIPAADADTRAVLGYLGANCGHCHDGTATISAQVPSLAFRDLLRDGDAVARALAGMPTRWQAPGRSAGTVVVDPGSPESSALLLRMASRRPSSQMPPLGTVVRDQEAIDAVRAWIGRLAVPR
jgi:hypothetical protein